MSMSKICRDKNAQLVKYADQKKHLGTDHYKTAPVSTLPTNLR